MGWPQTQYLVADKKPNTITKRWINGSGRIFQSVVKLSIEMFFWWSLLLNLLSFYFITSFITRNYLNGIEGEFDMARQSRFFVGKFVLAQLWAIPKLEFCESSFYKVVECWTLRYFSMTRGLESAKRHYYHKVEANFVKVWKIYWMFRVQEYFEFRNHGKGKKLLL